MFDFHVPTPTRGHPLDLLINIRPLRKPAFGSRNQLLYNQQTRITISPPIVPADEQVA